MYHLTNIQDRTIYPTFCTNNVAFLFFDYLVKSMIIFDNVLIAQKVQRLEHTGCESTEL